MPFPPIPKEVGSSQLDIHSIFLYLERLRNGSFDEVSAVITADPSSTGTAIGDLIVDTATIDLTYTASPASLYADLKDLSVTTVKLANKAVTFPKIQDINTTRLLGRITAGIGSIEEITLNTDLSFSAGALRISAFTGDVTKEAGGTALTITNNAVTFAKFQQISTDRLIGRDTAGTGNAEEISLSTELSFTGSGAIRITPASVTYAMIQNVSNASRILGRGSASGAGSIDEITVGSGLSITGTVVDLALATASGVYTPTLTNVANLDASTAYQCQYLRVGSVVTVSGKVDIDPTLTATSTQLGISLPIGSNIGTAEDCCGTAFSSGIASQGSAILGDAANNRAQLQYISTDTTNQAMYFTFTYRII